MKKLYTLASLALLGLLGTAACTAPTPEKNETETPQAKSNPLLGAWDLKEIHWIRKDTTVSLAPSQKGLLLFTENRYAIAWTPTRQARTPFENLSKPSDEEILTGFKTIVFNAGTYSNTDSTVSVKAEIAKVPGFEGGQQEFRMSLQDKKLNLTMYDETYPDGSKPAWAGIVEARMVWERLD